MNLTNPMSPTYPFRYTPANPMNPGTVQPSDDGGQHHGQSPEVVCVLFITLVPIAAIYGLVQLWKSMK